LGVNQMPLIKYTVALMKIRSYAYLPAA
jgi:hypothetical protein